MRRLLFAAFALSFTLHAALPGKTFTLEQVLSAPFPSDRGAAAGGGAVAWVQNDRGARNVWYAAAPDFKGVRLTSWTADDGQDIGELGFSGDGKSVLFVRGGDLEYPAQANPNPAGDPAGVTQDIWIVTPGEAPRRIAHGHSPAVSAKTTTVAYLRGGQIWTSAGQLIATRAGVTADDLTWSPDGTKLAFVSLRGNHSFVAVYDFATKAVSYMDPSVDYDSGPVWSGDGKRIAFIRIFQTAGSGRGSMRATGEPWSIRAADVADGTGRQIWRADAGAGSVFRGMVAAKQLQWNADGRIVFPWEKDGWLHLYSVSAEGIAKGGGALPLTPGDFEVDNVSFTDDGRNVLFSSNENDVDRRHIWRVPVSGGKPQAVTSGSGIEWRPVTVVGGVAYLHSDARRPARAAVRLGATERDLAPDSIPADFPADALVTPQQVVYTSSDGMKIHAQLFLPADLKAGEERPALVFLHGGSQRQMLLGWHPMGYYNNAYGMNQYLANRGYIVLAINYRSGIGYGLGFREAMNYGPSGASEFNDVEGAGVYLRGRTDVDGARIGLWGGSYGGYLTALGLARASDLFKAGVDFHGVHDWNAERPLNGPLDGTAEVEAEREDAAHLAFDSSPLASMKTWRSPVLLIHGDDDRNVGFFQTVNLVGALRAQGVDFEQLILPDEIHTFLRHGSWLKAYKATVDFLGRKL